MLRLLIPGGTPMGTPQPPPLTPINSPRERDSGLFEKKGKLITDGMYREALNAPGLLIALPLSRQL